MHAFSLSSSIFTFKLPLIPEPLGQRLIAVNMSDLHMPTVCLHKILTCHHAVCPTAQKRNLSFHNKVGFQALEMKPEQDKCLTMWRKQLKHKGKRCNYLLPTVWTWQLPYQSSHRWDESENKNTKRTLQSAASGGAAFTIKGHLRFVPSFEGCTEWLNTYHTRFPDVMADPACLWRGAWYQMAGAMVPHAASSEGAVSVILWQKSMCATVLKIGSQQ